jgi:hypothetical protein
MNALRSRLLALTVALVAPTAAWAQNQAATVASAAGTVEVQRSGSGEWQPATVGMPVFLLDHVRTAPSSAATLVFSDDAVIKLSDATQISIDRYSAANRGKGPHRSLIKLTGGTIEAIVSGYGEESHRFEIETATAVARVRSTQFVVRYDPRQKSTEVAGIEGVVAVQGRTGLIGPGVAVGPNEVTRVQDGRFPTPVEALDDAQRAELAGLRVIGTGNREGLDVDNPLVDGRMVAAEDRPAVAATAQAAAGVSFLRPSVPGERLIYQLSPDVGANTQPLPQYRAVPPISSPNPPH